MSIITLLIILIAIGGIMFGIYYHFNDAITKSLEIQKHNMKKEALLIDYYRMDIPFKPDNRNYFTKTQTWTNKSDDEIYHMGYDKAEKWMDDLRYAGVPIFVKLHNFRMFDIYSMDEPNRIGSAVLYNVYRSRTVGKFISGLMTRIGFPTMDIKTIAVMVPIAIGVVVGMLYFMR